MYIFAYSSAPAPEYTTFSHIIEASSFDELVTKIRDSVFYESFKMMCADPPEPPKESIQDVVQILAEEKTVNNIFLNTVQLLFQQMETAQKNQSQADLDACIQLFNSMFGIGNFTCWDFGMKVIADDDELAAFIAGDMGYYCDSREEAEKVLDSHIKNWRMKL